jgi:starch-binding outer membrane protein, SusD/RagB family
MKNFLYRKNGNLFLIVLLAIFALSTSCKKYINEEPISQTYSEKFWTSETSVNQASLAMYLQLRNCLRSGNSHFIFGDLTTDLFHCSYNCDWTLNAVKSSNNPPFNFSYVPYKEGDLQNWSRFYKLIAQANLVMQNVPDMPESLFASPAQKKSYIGEALFMRAYTYFYITRVWGDPCYVAQTYNDVDYGNIPGVARTPEATVLNYCKKDLLTAASYMDYSGGDPSMAIRANKGTAYALLAHIYAWQNKYDSAHIYCQKVINEGGYTLEPWATYNKIWAGQSSGESIFELPMMANDVSSISETSFGFFGVFMKDALVDNQKTHAWIIPSGWSWLWQSTDKRFTSNLKAVEAANGDEKGFVLLKYTGFKYQTPATRTSPYIDNNLVLLRLSDIILLDAEALASVGNLEGARNLLKLTEQRAGATTYLDPTDQYGMLDEVVMERGRELIGEGSWYYDLIRTESRQGWLESFNYPHDRLSTTNKGYYWPLDMASLFPQNNLLTQNPWWTSHK